MHPAGRRPRILGSRLGLFLAALAATSIASLITILALYGGLQERQRGIRTGARENALWAAYQADREAGRFIEAIVVARLRPHSEELQEVRLRYDVLYSRAQDLDQVLRTAQVQTTDEIEQAAKLARETITGLAGSIDGFAGDDPAFVTALPEFQERASAIRLATQELALEANTSNNAARVAERDALSAIHDQITRALGILTGAVALFAGLLIWQLVTLARTSRRLRDMSERNARAAEAAEAGNRAKSAFLAMMSHEIRTPLNGIIGMADLLAEARLSPAEAERVAVIRQSGDLLLDIITDVLDFSKLESGMVEPILCDMPVSDAIEQVRKILAPRAEAKGLQLIATAPDVLVRTDPSLLRQVIINLVGNAIKFTPAGFVRLSVRHLDGGRLRVEVEDTGVGIAEDAKPKLFQEFSQVDDSHSRRFGGTGLGLAICKRLVEALGGEIHVASRLGEGSRFWFEIPVGPARPIERCTEPSVPLAPLRRRSGRVLVVEDNSVNRQVACGLLEVLGFEPGCASNGAEAVAVALAESFDLVLMDMQMPVMDGLTATRQLRSRGYRGLIVGLTANAFVSDREACLAAGMDEFVSKPITRAKLEGLWDSLSPADPGASAGERASADLPGGVPAADAAQRQALVDELGADVVEELLREFAGEAARDLAATRSALLAGDEATAARCLHTIKGAAQTLGFGEIGALAHAAREKPEEALLDRIDQLLRAAASAPAPRLCA